jgi:hypothetical protein
MQTAAAIALSGICGITILDSGARLEMYFFKLQK